MQRGESAGTPDGGERGASGRERKGEEGRGRERKGEKGRGRERKGEEGRGRERKREEERGRERKREEESAAAAHRKRCEVEVDAAACREVNAGSGGIIQLDETNEGAHGCWKGAGWSLRPGVGL